MLLTIAWWCIFQWALDLIFPPEDKPTSWSRNWHHQFELFCYLLWPKWVWLVSTTLSQTLVFPWNTFLREVWGFTWSILTTAGACTYLNYFILKFYMEILKMAWVLFSFYSINLMIMWWWWWKALTPSLHSIHACHLLEN